MNTNRKISIKVGILFIVATVAGIISISLTEPIMSVPNYLINMSENGIQLKIGLIFELIMGLAVASIAIIIYPVLKKQNSSLAIGYVASRVVEAVFYLIDITLILSLFSLGNEYVSSGAPTISYFHTMAELILKARDWSGHVLLDIGVFGIGAFILYYVMFKSNLIPKWISGWGIVSILMYILAAFLVLFGVKPLSPVLIILSIPLALNEMVMAIWLIAKGFNKKVLNL